MYFFAKNAGVDGCSSSDEPGYEAFEWLRVRLQLLRERGMKAILSGHVPPARTDSKQQWDETCWQKYALWLRQYRDVIVGGLWGHMNVDHFMLQDFQEIDLDVLGVEQDGVERDEDRTTSGKLELRKRADDDFTIASSEDYLKDLRDEWADLPTPPPGMVLEELAHDELSSVSDDSRPEWEIDLVVRRHQSVTETNKKDDEKKRQQFLKKIGGQWHERYGVSLVSPSVVPNYFPTLRVFEYNLTGVDMRNAFDANRKTILARAEEKLQQLEKAHGQELDSHTQTKGKKGKKPKFALPDPPSKSAPPGPAYSPQSLTLVGYTQYYANLTEINNDFHNKLFEAAIPGSSADEAEGKPGATEALSHWMGRILKWKGGKYHDKKPKKSSPQPKDFKYQVEYDTRNDKVFKLKDLTVGSWVRLARRIGEKGKADGTDFSHPDSGEEVQETVDLDADAETEGDSELDQRGDVEARKNHKHKKGKKHEHKGKKKHKENKVWHTFIQRAFVSTMSAKEIDDTYG